MKYEESKKILREVQRAKRILLNCHRGPDPDSIGSALAMNEVLKKMGKKVSVVCPTGLDKRMTFLPGFDEIQSEVDFNGFDFTKFDLLLTLDSSDWQMVVGDEGVVVPEIPICVIDHHLTNTGYGKINLIDKDISSVGELLYRVFQDWRVKMDEETSTALLTAIIGDTGMFKFTNTTPQTLNIASKLLELGARKDEIIHKLYRSTDEDTIKFTGEVLRRIEIDKKNKFVWSAVPYAVYKKYNKTYGGKELATSIYSQSIEGTNFGFMLLEKNKRVYSISFRGRSDNVDVSKLAMKLGGGGHRVAAGGGASLEGMDYDNAVDKVLKEARKFARECKQI